MKTGTLNSIPREASTTPFFCASLLVGLIVGDISVICFNADVPTRVICAIAGLAFGWFCTGNALKRAQEAEQSGDEVSIEWSVPFVFGWCFFLLFWVGNWGSHPSDGLVIWWACCSITISSLIEAATYTLATILMRKDFSVWFKNLCVEKLANPDKKPD